MARPQTAPPPRAQRTAGAPPASLLTVVVRTVDRPQRLSECLESLAAQRDRRFEVVVVDMSGGAARAAVDAVRDWLPGLVHVDTGGRLLNRSRALNAGIEAGRGDVVAILDDDNLWEPEHVGVLLGAFADPEVAFAYTGVVRRAHAPDGALLHEDRLLAEFDPDFVVAGNTLHTTATGFRRSAWREAGGFDPRFPVYEDWEFLIRATRGRRVVSIPAYTAITRSFVGVAGVAEHAHREAAECLRCRIGVHWTHRRLLSPAFFERHAARLASGYEHLPRRGVRRCDLRRLLSWWTAARLRRLRGR
jgi:glycosyltransferase involved in cell wall biosynthesis